MATLMVIAVLRKSRALGFRCECFVAARLGQRGQIAPAVACLDQVHAVPLERLLDEELAAQPLVECACGLVACDDPRQEPCRAVGALRLDDGSDEPPPEPDVLELAPQIDRDEL